MASNIKTLEWLNANMHRNYPLSDGATSFSATSRLTLPSSFLCDIAIDLPPGWGEGTWYISNITRLTENLIIRISYKESNTSATDMAVFESAIIPLDIKAGDAVEEKTFSLYVLPEAMESDIDLQTASGEVVIGTCEDMEGFPGTSFAVEETEINNITIRSSVAGIQRITVIDSEGVSRVLYNDFTIEAGNGIALTVSEDGTTVTINTTDETTEDIITELVEKVYADMGGPPILNINGIIPDADGKMTVTGLDCTQVVGTQHGISISNPCAVPCCPSDSTEDISNALQALEDAKERLLKYHESLDNNIQAMQARLSSLIASQGGGSVEGTEATT